MEAIKASISKKYPEAWIEWLRKNDLAFFAEDMLNMEVADVHKRWSQLVTLNEKLCIQAPRDHGKSFFFSFAYAIWRAYYNWIPSRIKDSKDFKSIPRVSIGYIFSNTQDQAIKLLDLVKREIEENPKLWHLIPEKKDVWSKTEIKLSNGAIIRARGWGVSVRGAHPVWIIADDCLNDESIYSELTRKKQIDYFFSAVTPMLVPFGQLVVVGTPFHQEDLYDKLRKNVSYTFHTFPAINQKGEALWPTRYTKEALMKRKDEVGSTRFSREYLCNAVSDDASLFPDYIIERCFADIEMLPYITADEYKEIDVFMGVDLALSSVAEAEIATHVSDLNPHTQYLQDLPQVWSGGIWVARPTSGGNNITGTGSFNKPFATLQKAIDWINNTVHDNMPVNNPTIFVKPGEYNLLGEFVLDGTVSPNLANGITIIGHGNTDSTPVRFIGGFTLRGNITRVRFKDFQIAPGTGVYSLDVDGTQGRHYFDNITFSGGAGIRFRNAYQRWTEFMNCSCSTFISLGNGATLANASVRFRGFSDWGATITIDDVNMRLEMLDTYRSGRIVHIAGKVILSNHHEIRSTNGNAIESSASGVNDRLIIVNANMRRWDTFAYGLIDKTGTCSYELFNVNRNTGSDTLNGTPL